VDCTADRDQVLEQPARNALEAETGSTREGGKQEWWIWQGGKGKGKKAGKGDVRNVDVTHITCAGQQIAPFQG
jgi:hypothetical protein